MATLIQSKQIQGVVTASVVQGDFQVSGSLIVTGSGIFTSDITASNTISASRILGVNYDDISGTPNFVAGTGISISQTGDNITITNTGGVGGGSTDISHLNSFTASYYIDSSSFDSRISGISASGSGADWNVNLQNIPSGLVSGSVLRTLDGTGVVSGSSQISFTGITNVPSGLVSSSTQITDGSGIVSGSVLRTLDGSGVLSASVDFNTYSASVATTIDNIQHTQIPSGVISGSTFTDFSSSVDSRLTTLENTTDLTGSDSQTLSLVGDQLTISGGNTVTLPSGSGGSVPAGTISGSAQITSLGFISESFSTNGTGILSGSIVDQLPGGIISGSTYTTFSSSIDSRIDTEKSRIDNILSGANADYDQFVEIVNLINSTDTTNDVAFANHYTSSRQRLTSLENFTQSIDTTIKSKLNTDAVLSGSIESLLPSGVISGSTQITDGSNIVSGSVLRTLDGTGVFSGSLVAGSNITINQVGNNFEISSSASGGSASVTVSDSAPGSPSQGDLWWKSDDGNLYIYYDGYWVISTDITTGLPAGVVSGSTQITSVITDAYISASAASSGFGSGGSSDFTTLTNVPSGLVSGSTQITDGSNIVSGSVLRTLDGTGVLSASVTFEQYSASVQTTIDNIVHTQIPAGTISGSDQVTQSLDSRYLQSSTYTTDSASFDTRISSLVSSETPAGTVSSSLQTISHLGGTNIFSGSVIGQGTVTITSGSGNIIISGSGVGGSSDVTFDGNRVISNEDLGDLFTNQVNPGTSGSIQDFLNAVFYPNTGPSISTGNQTISEYVSNGTTIVTLSGTDPEGQTITWGTGSSYTDDLVRVASNGVMTLNALAESSSFNTDSVGGGHGHLVTVKATDTFNTSTEKDIYIIVTPNEAPKFRQTSVGGSVITSFTANLNENSTNGTVVGTIYFTDAESDSITIYSSSIDNNHFVINKYSTYVQIVQNTGSLDYEQQTSYSFSISASDEHYEAGQDLDSITTLPITINVTDNQIPVVNNQTLSSINENSSNGATVDSIAASDNEGDTITFLNFNLHKLLLDGVEVSSGSYSGTSQLTDPSENPFQMNSSGVVTRKTGVYLNSDLINSYQYRVQVKDDFNTSSPASIVTIPITDDTPATLSDNWSTGPFIKESEVSGTTIKTTNYGSTTADYNSNQSGTWSSSNPAISINSNGNLSLGVDLSGSVTQSGDTLDSTITFTNTFGTTTTDNLSVTIVANSAPTATFTDQSSKFNTNLATNGTNLVSVTISDTESDTPYQLSVSGTNGSSFTAVPQNSASSSWQLQANGNLSAGSYSYDVTVTDSYSKSTTYSGRSITIAQASSGTMTENGTFYIIESATNGDLIRTSSNGRTGTQGSVSVSYSPNYGSQSAGSFTSSNGLISINSSTGVLSVGTDISGSGNTNGSTITSTIGWTDQYGNVGSDTITVNVAKNNAPTLLSAQVSNDNTNQARSTNQILQLRATDIEGDTIPNSGLSLSGYNTTYFTPNISTPYLQLLVNNTNVPAGTYPYTASFQDEHGFDTTTVSGSFTITQSDTGTLGGDTSIYIIESAESGVVFRDATGYNQGNAAQLSVSYSPNDGSAAVQSYTSSNAAIVVDSSGNLTLGVDISGSVTQSGDTFTSTITFQDQYGNVGNGSVTATVFGNSSPSATFTAESFNTDEAISGSNIGTVTVTDTENNSPFTITLGGTDGGKFDVSGSSSPFTIQPTGSLAEGSYSINITVTDTYGESVTLTGETITVSAANDYGKVYIYTSTRTGGGLLSNDNYDGLMGITSENTSFEPDLITGYQSTGPSPIYAFKTGYLGSGSVTVGGGTMTLRNTVSGSNLDTIISSSFNGNGSTAEQVMIIFPSGSDMDGIPTSMTDSLGGSTTGEYVLYLKAAGESSYTAAGTQIHMFDVDSAVDGYSRWNIIGRNSVNTAASYEVRLIPSSGSAP